MQRRRQGRGSIIARKEPWPRLVFGVVAIALVLCSSTLGQAQEPSAVDRADQLFREGREAMRRGDVATACPKFAESQRLDPAPGTLINLAECEERLGRLTEAWKHLQQVVRLLPADDDRLPIAREQATALDRRIPRLSLRLAPDAPASSTILLDNTERVTPGTTIVVDPGSHVVATDAPGYRLSLKTVRVAEGQRVELVVAPEPLPRPNPPPPTSNTRATLGWVIGGVGVVALGTTAVTALVLNGKQNTVDAHCDPDRLCDQEGYDAARTGRRLEPLYWGSFALGAAGLATGALLLATSPKTSTRTQVTAGARPGGAELTLRGAFW